MALELAIARLPAPRIDRPEPIAQRTEYHSSAETLTRLTDIYDFENSREMYGL